MRLIFQSTIDRVFFILGKARILFLFVTFTSDFFTLSTSEKHFKQEIFKPRMTFNF